MPQKSELVTRRVDSDAAQWNANRLTYLREVFTYKGLMPLRVSNKETWRHFGFVLSSTPAHCRWEVASGAGHLHRRDKNRLQLPNQLKSIIIIVLNLHPRPWRIPNTSIAHTSSLMTFQKSHH